MPDTRILSGEEVDKIAARKTHQYNTMVSLTIAERDALCATVRVLRAENDELRQHVKDLNHDLEATNKHCEECHYER